MAEMSEVSTEQALQEKLEEMELRVKGILGSIPAGIVFVTMEGRIEAVTEQFEQLCQYETKDICNRNISKFLPSQLSEADLAKRLAQGCEDGLIAAQLLKKDGTEVPVKLTVSMIDTVEGVGLMLCILDASKESIL